MTTRRASHVPPTKSFSAGIVPIFRASGEPDLFLVLRCYSYWDFPKGGMVPEETPMVCALRELKEENDRLKAQIANMQANTANVAVSDDVQAQVKRNEDKLNKIENFKVLETTQAAMNKRIISAMQTEESKNRMNPQLVNLTEDEQSNRKDVEDLTSPATCLVGRRNKSDPSKDP